MLDLDIHTSRQHPEDGDDWHRELQKRRLWLVDIKGAAPSPHVPHNALKYCYWRAGKLAC